MSYGDLFIGFKPSDTFILNEIVSHNISLYEDSYPLSWTKIHPESISCFTGIYDKHGEQIFENDLIKPDNYPVSKVVYCPVAVGFCAQLEEDEPFDEKNHDDENLPLKKNNHLELMFLNTNTSVEVL